MVKVSLCPSRSIALNPGSEDAHRGAGGSNDFRWCRCLRPLSLWALNLLRPPPPQPIAAWHLRCWHILPFWATPSRRHRSEELLISMWTAAPQLQREICRENNSVRSFKVLKFKGMVFFKSFLKLSGENKIKPSTLGLKWAESACWVLCVGGFYADYDGLMSQHTSGLSWAVC